MPDLSIVVPTLDEAAHLGVLLGQLARSVGVDAEVIVTDGGSTDGTVALAERFGARVVQGSPGRGRQLNRGRAEAQGALLLFLHADSRLSSDHQLADAVAALREAEQSAGGPVAGHFQLRFHDAQGPAFTYYEALSALGRPQTVNGDQGLLLAADWLDALGGFHESLPFLEDQALGRRIDAEGAWVLLPGRLETSARRFLVEGIGERSIHNAVTMAFFTVGHSAFLARAPERYRAQPRCGRLRVAPLAREVAGLLWLSPRLLLHLAAYANRHALWRGAFWLDVRHHGALAATHHPRLRAYDRWIAPWMRSLVGDRLCVPPLVATFGAVWLVYGLREARAVAAQAAPVGR